MNESISIPFNHKQPYKIIVGEPGVSYKQAGRYFNQAFKPAQLQEVKELTSTEKEIEELRAKYADALIENGMLLAQIAKLQLMAVQIQKPVDAIAKVSETIIVDTKEGVSTVTSPLPPAITSRTLSLSGIKKAVAA